MKVKKYNEQTMSFISLILPVERRKVVHFLSPEDRLNKALTGGDGGR